MFSLDKYKMGALVVALALCGGVTFACDSSSKTSSASPDPELLVYPDSQPQPQSNQGKHG